MDARTEEIRARVEKATPGPWEVQYDINLKAPDPRGGTLCPLSNSSLSAEQRAANFSFVANARQDVPYLLTELTALREEVERLKGALGKIRDEAGGECGCEDHSNPDCCGTLGMTYEERMKRAALSPSPAQQEPK